MDLQLKLGPAAARLLIPFTHLCHSDFCDLMRPALQGFAGDNPLKPDPYPPGARKLFNALKKAREPFHFYIDFRYPGSERHFQTPPTAGGIITVNDDTEGLTLQYWVGSLGPHRLDLRLSNPEKDLLGADRHKAGRALYAALDYEGLAARACLAVLPLLLASDAVRVVMTNKKVMLLVEPRWGQTDEDGVPVQPLAADGWLLTRLVGTLRERVTLYQMGRVTGSGEPGGSLPQQIERFRTEIDDLSRVHPFRLSRGACMMIRRFALANERTLDQARALMGLPGENIWVEWSDEEDWTSPKTLPCVQLVPLEADDDGNGELRGSIGGIFRDAGYFAPVGTEFRAFVVSLWVGEPAELDRLPEWTTAAQWTKPAPQRHAEITSGFFNPKLPIGDLLTAMLATLVAPKGLERKPAKPTDSIAWQAVRRVRERLDPHGKRRGPASTRDVTMLLLPGEPGDGSEPVTGITGARAYHWVRAFFRVRLGRVEFVRDHHRGWKALGLVNVRHKVFMDQADVIEQRYRNEDNPEGKN